MSNDLVKRLHERSGVYDAHDWHSGIELEAADRIEALEKALREIAEAVGDPSAYWIARAALGEDK